MSSENQSILNTHHLEIGYKKSKLNISVLREINVYLNPGEFVCFMGPNGIGKSTLLRTISGVQPPLSGEILVNKKPVQKLSLNERAKYLSIVLTERVYNNNLSVYELISLGRYPYTNWSGNLTSNDKDKIENAISLTKTENLLNQKLHTLSDGQLQKAMIARALAQDCNIMILDEPTAHLDLNNRLEIMHLLLDMAHSTQKSILVATHELDLAVQTADRLWLAGKERTIISGTPEDLVLNGEVENTFADERIKFDLYSGRFKVPNYSKKFAVVAGKNPEKMWTKYALERIGFKVLDEKASTSDIPKIEIEIIAEKKYWRLTNYPFEGIYETLGELTDTLQVKR